MSPEAYLQLLDRYRTLQHAQPGSEQEALREAVSSLPLAPEHHEDLWLKLDADATNAVLIVQLKKRGTTRKRLGLIIAILGLLLLLLPLSNAEQQLLSPGTALMGALLYVQGRRSDARARHEENLLVKRFSRWIRDKAT